MTALHPVFEEGDYVGPDSGEAPTLARAMAIEHEIAVHLQAVRALEDERRRIYAAFDGPAEEVHPHGIYRLTPRTRMTARSIDTAEFVRRFPERALDCGTVRISVAKAEKALSAEDFALVVIPGEEVPADPVLAFEPTVGPRPRG